MIEFAPILRNSALLLSLTFIYSLFIPVLRRYARPVTCIVTGILFGIFSIFTMNDPIYMTGGGIMDARHVIVMVAGILGGWQGGLIAAVISSAYRIFLDGVGVIPGVNSIITAALLGIAYHRFTGGNIRFNRSVFLLGILVALVPLSWLWTMPDGIGWRAYPVVTMPIMVTYPLATYMLMWLLSITYQRLDLLNTVWQFEQRHDAMFLQTPTLLMGIKPDNTIANVNPAMLAFLKREEHEILGKNPDVIDWHDIPVPVLQEFDSALKEAFKGETVRKSLIFKRENGIQTLDSLFIPLSNRQGDIEMILIESNDISGELHAKENELALQFAEERNDILKQLIGDASHHLRTPLSIISSSIYLLRKNIALLDLDTDTRDTIERHFKKMSEAQVDLNEIVEDLLSLMRLDSVEQHSFHPHDLVSFVREIADNYQAIAREKEIDLVMELPDYPIPTALAREPFRRVIENLIENGLRYTPNGGLVTVSVIQKNDSAIYRVRDNGVGIPEEDVPRIFDRFFRAGNALTVTRKGTGLGLAIVKKTVDLHQGQIDVTSEVDKGSTFTVSLPLKTNPELVPR